MKKDDVKADAKEAVPKSKAEGKKAEGKKAEEAKLNCPVVAQPMDGDGNPIDTGTCAAIVIEEEPTKKSKRSKR